MLQLGNMVTVCNSGPVVFYFISLLLLQRLLATKRVRFIFEYLLEEVAILLVLIPHIICKYHVYLNLVRSLSHSQVVLLQL